VDLSIVSFRHHLGVVQHFAERLNIHRDQLAIVVKPQEISAVLFAKAMTSQEISGELLCFKKNSLQTGF
jgi:L-lactate utilization protein LutB